FGKRADKTDQRVALGVAGGLADANFLEFLGLQPRELAEQAVRGHAVIAAGRLADDELDGFLIAFAERARSKHGIGGKHCLERRGPWAPIAAKVIGTWPMAFLICA